MLQTAQQEQEVTWQSEVITRLESEPLYARKNESCKLNSCLQTTVKQKINEEIKKLIEKNCRKPSMYIIGVMTMIRCKIGDGITLWIPSGEEKNPFDEGVITGKRILNNDKAKL
jgi:hypothetical protein